jgi:hypothetical protein
LGYDDVSLVEYLPTFRRFWVIDPEGATMSLINVEHCSLGDIALQPRRLYYSNKEQFARRHAVLMASLALTPIIPREKQNIIAACRMHDCFDVALY